MQDEISEKLIALCINGGKISARILKESMESALTELERNSRQERQDALEKRKEKRQKGKEQTETHGKQSLRKLSKNGIQLSNIEVTDGNIRSFARCARKYDVDYSLKKDNSVSPPRYFVFFRAKDVDVLTAAFKEYTGKVVGQSKKPSVRKKLE